MNCEHCGKKIPLHRVLRDNKYCSVEHRSIHRRELNNLGLALLVRLAHQESSGAPTGGRLPMAGFLGDNAPLASASSPKSQAAPLDFPASLQFEKPAENRRPLSPERAKFGLGRPVLAALFTLVLALPLMSATVAYPPPPPPVGAAAGFWQLLRDAVRARATVDLSEDFSADLQGWAGSDGLPQSWVADKGGFVRPGELAIYIKSVPLSDYRIDFMGVIERKSLSFVYRAMDFDNYYAARITILKPGPVPEVALERYAVIGGQAGPKTQVKLPFAVRMDTIYKVRLEAQGSHFITHINGQFVDAFSDDRLSSGGVGFFSMAGESACIRRLHITNRDDLFGKICSLLAPHFGD